MEEGGCVTVVTDPAVGRYLRASRAIRAGEVLLSERPSAWWVDPSFRQTTCARCLAACGDSQQREACQACGGAVWCSAACRTEDADRHAVLAPWIKASEAWRKKRAVAETAGTCKGAVAEAEAEEAVEEEATEDASLLACAASVAALHAFDRHTFDRVWAMHAPPLTSREEERCSALASWCEQAALSATMPLGDLLRGCCARDRANSLALTSLGGCVEEAREHRPHGYALYPTLALANHSCLPTAARVDAFVATGPRPREGGGGEGGGGEGGEGEGAEASGELMRNSGRGRGAQLRYSMDSMGCQMNTADAERMEGQLRALGFARAEEGTPAQVVVLNTCSIREHAEAKVYSYLGPHAARKRAGEDLAIVVAGCVAQQEGEALLRRVPEIDMVMGPQYANRLGDLLEGVFNGNQIVATAPTHIMEDPTQPQRSSTVCAWVNVIYGCNERCTYCVVPTTRGSEQSRPRDAVRAEIEALVAEGYREVTLLGQNIDSWGSDLSPKQSFADLLRDVGGVDGLARMRFVTSHPR